MAIGDIGHWRDSAGSQIPGTTWGGMNFATQIRNDNSTYSKPTSSQIEIEEAGTFLIIANVRTRDTSNGRYNHQMRCSISTGSGNLWTSYYTGYSRDTSEDDAFCRLLAVYHNAAANDVLNIEWRRDTDAPIGGSVINESDVQIVRIDYQAIGMYNDTGSGSAYGGTTPNTVTLNNTIVESNASIISRTGSTVTLVAKTTRFLVLWCVAGDTGGSRTQRIGHLERSGSDILPSRSYAYQRQASDEYAGFGGMWLIETTGGSESLEIEAFRGPGVLADEGGADIDGSWVHTANFCGMCVIAVPATLEVFVSHDSTGLQDITGTTKYTINAMRDVDLNDASSFTKTSNTVMNVEKAADVLIWSNVWTARNNVSAGTRLTAVFNIDIDGTDQTVGVHGNYSRGNQSTQDCFGFSAHAGGIFAIGAGEGVSLEGVRLTGGEAGGADRTQANTVGFIAINLDTFAAAAGGNVKTRDTIAIANVKTWDGITDANTKTVTGITN